MTVAELIAALQTMPQDMQVITLGSDSSGYATDDEAVTVEKIAYGLANAREVVWIGGKTE